MIKKRNLFKKITFSLILMLSLFNFSKANYDKVFYDYSIKSIDGLDINLSEYRNKAVLLVNVASYCGFTKQYGDLQKIWEKYRDKGLIVLGVPSRSFNQEKDTEGEVKDFCEVNFSITFPMTAIFDVKGDNAHEIYKWAKENYGKKSVPKWNFYKILINKNGKIEDTFASFTNPNSNKIIKAIEKVLN
tara:strand:+ start:1350 stop:1913 length:564 start_codon:yes stop_codon:yes gene_type:complete